MPAESWHLVNLIRMQEQRQMAAQSSRQSVTSGVDDESFARFLYIVLYIAITLIVWVGYGIGTGMGSFLSLFYSMLIVIGNLVPILTLLYLTFLAITAVIFEVINMLDPKFPERP